MGLATNCNNPELEWVVQKYGGTSIGKYAFEIAKDIIRETLRQNRVAVVCSARSTTSKAAGTTTRLIEIFNILEASRSRGAAPLGCLATLQTKLQVIVEEHIAAVAPSLGSKASQHSFSERLALESQNTVSAVAGALFSDKYDYGFVQDLLMSLGEKLSCLCMVAILQDLDIEAEYVDLSTILPRHSAATAKCPSSYAALSTAIARRLSACGTRVPVITGFFGCSDGDGGMLASAVGRGYTDLCAALCAVGLGAAALQIWKEVDGILTADPSRVPRAQLIPHMSLAEAAALTEHGSEVVHALAIRHVMEAAPGMALCIRNVKRPAGAGTVVAARAGEAANDSDTECTSLKSVEVFCRAVTVKNNVCVLHLRPREGTSCFPKRAKTFSRDAATVEFTTPDASRLSPSSKSRRWPTFYWSYIKRFLFGPGRSGSSQSASVITLICSRADGHGRLASQVRAILRSERIPSTLLPQADDSGCISCVVPLPDTLRAMNLLHDQLCLLCDD